MPPTKQGSEHWHQAMFFSIIRRINHVAGRRTYSSTNGYLRTSKMRIRAWREGCLSGVWDVHNPVPMNGRPGQYIEFKSGNNTLTPEQIAFRDDMLMLKYRMDVVRSWEEGIKVFCDYLGIEIHFPQNGSRK